jgi:hypothetical protein
MTMFKIFLDTNALIFLSGLKRQKLEEFRKGFNTENAELIITTVQVDEKRKRKKDEKYQEAISKAIATLKDNDIQVKVETANIGVFGISRFGYFSFGTPEISNIYDELDKKVAECEKAKGRSKDPLNVKRDAVISVSPLEYSFLITTDKCLNKSFNQVMKEQKKIVEKVVVPKARLAKASSEAVADCILKVFSDRR